MPTPTTETEKSRAPLSAVTTGLTGRTMLFSAADAEIYQKHLARFFAKYSALGDDENDLVQKIVDFEWRLLRSAPLEAAIYAVGRDQCAHLVAHETDPVRREGALLAQIYFMYKKDLAAIASEERRLTNQRDKAVAKLEALQKERKDARIKELDRAEKSIKACALNNLIPDFEYFGFDFSIEEFETYSVRRKTFFTLTGGKSMNFDQFLLEFRAQAAESEAQAAA
jgi:hypothetical protein